jgi:hypothetical protein
MIHGKTFPGAYSSHGKEGKTSQKMCGVRKKRARGKNLSIGL